MVRAGADIAASRPDAATSRPAVPTEMPRSAAIALSRPTGRNSALTRLKLLTAMENTAGQGFLARAAGWALSFMEVPYRVGGAQAPFAHSIGPAHAEKRRPWKDHPRPWIVRAAGGARSERASQPNRLASQSRTTRSRALGCRLGG